MQLTGTHTITVCTLAELRDELDKLPSSVLESAVVKDADLDYETFESFGSGTTAIWWTLTLDLQWPVDLA